jgi:hypothetical protein
MTTVIIAGVLFLKRKSDLKEKVKTLLTDLHIAGLNVRFIRCDDAGENMSMKSDQDLKSFGVKFEFSGPRTPQRNGKVGRKFQTFFGRIQSMLNGAGLTGDLRNKIWAECAMTTTYLANILSSKSILKSPFEFCLALSPSYIMSSKYLVKLEWSLQKTRSNPSLPIVDLLVSLLAMQKTIQEISTEC